MRSAKHDIYGLAILRLRADLAIHAVLENTDFIQPSTISTALQYSDCRLVIRIILQGGVYGRFWITNAAPSGETSSGRTARNNSDSAIDSFRVGVHDEIKTLKLHRHGPNLLQDQG